MISEIIQPAFLSWTFEIEQSSYLRILLSIAYLTCSGFALACQYIALKNNIGNARVWKLVTIISFCGFIDTILQPETFITEILRNSTKLNNWYFDLRFERQILQFFVLGIIIIASLKIAKTLKIQGETMNKTNILLAVGIGVMIGMFILRLVSFHYTDSVISFRVFWISIGRVIDFAGIACTSLGIIRFMFHKST